ncbi:hypothetical protein Tco_1366253 [Tanacetum coccineum]
MFKDSDFDDLDDLVDEGMAFVQEKDAENQGKIGADDTEVVNTTGEGVSTVAPRTPSTTTTVFDDKDVTMAMAQTLIKMKEEKAKEKGETEPVEKKKKKVQADAQIERDARIDADYELATRMTQEEQKKYTIKERARSNPKKPKVMKYAKDVTEEEAAEYEKEKEELSCGVHTLFMDGKPMEINMLVKKKYPLIKELLETMLNLQLEAEEESTMAFELIKFIKSLLEE